MSVKRIAVGGSAANPPHLGHRYLVKNLLQSGLLDQIVWIPSGVRSDKPGFVGPDHRVAMTMLNFPTTWWWILPTSFRVKFDDVYGDNTPTIEYLERLRRENPEAELVWFTGVDSVVPQKSLGGKCEIEASWDRGEELMEKWPFLILPRPGFPHPNNLDLPPQFEVLDIAQKGITSTEVKDLIADGEEFQHLVPPGVAGYIKRHGLYGWKGKVS